MRTRHCAAVYLISILTLIMGCQGGSGPIAPPASQTILASFSHSAPDDYVIGKTIFFDASGSSDQLFKIVKYLWDWGDGSQISVSDNPGASHVFNGPKTYEVKLTIVDQADRRASSTQSARIYLPGSAPVARFTYEAPDGWQPGSVLDFDASSSSDVDGDIVSYEWDWGDGMSPESVSQSTISHHFDTEGLKKVTLNVTDSTGRQAASDPIEISVGYPDDLKILDAYLLQVSDSHPGGGPGVAVKIDGRYAYTLLGGHGLRVFDMLDGASPKLVGQAVTSLNSLDLEVLDGFAYIADFDNGLLIFDVRNPTRPSLVNSIGNQGAEAVVLSEGYAYVSGYDFADYYSPGGLINIQGPEHAFLCSTLHSSLGGQGTCLALSGDFVYSGYGLYDLSSGIEIINIRDPVALSSHGRIELDLVPLDLEAVNGILYMLLEGDYTTSSRLETYDLANPDEPVRISSIDVDGARDMQVLGSYAYCASNDGLVILDISDPTNPVIFKSLKIPRHPWRVGVFENRALVLSYSPGNDWMNVTNMLLW